MPNTKSAKKALRKSRRSAIINAGKRKAARDIAKEIELLAKGGKKAEAQKLISRAYQLFDKATKTGVVKRGNADRKKSRLARLVRTS